MAILPKAIYRFNPLQYSCLENPMDRETCRATVHGVTKEGFWLSQLNNNNNSFMAHVILSFSILSLVLAFFFTFLLFSFLFRLSLLYTFSLSSSLCSWLGTWTPQHTHCLQICTTSDCPSLGGMACAWSWGQSNRKLRAVQFSSVAQLCLTLCKPMDCSMPGLPVHHQLLEFAQTQVHWVGDAVQPSHPLSSPPSPSFNLSQHQGLSNESALCIRWPKDWSFSFRISTSNEYSRLISFRMDWFGLLAV